MRSTGTEFFSRSQILWAVQRVSCSKEKPAALFFPAEEYIRCVRIALAFCCPYPTKGRETKNGTVIRSNEYANFLAQCTRISVRTHSVGGARQRLPVWIDATRCGTCLWNEETYYRRKIERAVGDGTTGKSSRKNCSFSRTINVSCERPMQLHDKSRKTLNG